METYQQSLQEEEAYLEKIITIIKNELFDGTNKLSDKKSELRASRKDMYENTVQSSNDFDKLSEVSQYLSEVNMQAANYDKSVQLIEKHKKMLSTPYFGRFDFKEDAYDALEKIYIGLQNLIDPKTQNIFIYDWRAPISSMFYQFEIGKAEYKAPVGNITGEIFLKRQYKILNSKLKFFFDCSITINDEVLQEILGHNSSDKMKNIVQTIQKEQDIIIRDTDNELLIVQGVAGSGKTSVALHRVAFILYQGLHSNISINNIIIVSPNAIFSKYISSVLPELGEENVEQTTFFDIASIFFANKFSIESRETQLETIINTQYDPEGQLRKEMISFKGSKVFVEILNRFLWHYAHKKLPFEDVYFNGQIIETRQKLKNRFLNNKLGIPMAKQLKKIENLLLDRIYSLRMQRLERIEKIVQMSEGHDFEIKSFSRLLSIKEAKVFLKKLQKFTEVDFFELYKMLFNKKGLLLKLAKGLELPENIEKILAQTNKDLQNDKVYYEDSTALLFLKLKIEGNELFKKIKQVVIDEAQDYYPMHYEIFNILFKDAKYTVLGDFNQTIEKESVASLYDDISNILNKQKTLMMMLKKGYRSSYEINAFTHQLLGFKQDIFAFERREEEPVLIHKENLEEMEKAIVQDIHFSLEQGYESIAIICKSQLIADKIYANINPLLEIKLITPDNDKIEKGVMIIPAYMAKGLEFDVVLVYDVNRINFSDELDNKLLYIACTRALHRLSIYYTDVKSPLLP